MLEYGAVELMDARCDDCACAGGNWVEVSPDGCDIDCLRSADLEFARNLDLLLAGSGRFSGEFEKLLISMEGLRVF